MIFSKSKDNIKITEYNENDYIKLINLLYGLDSIKYMKFKDNNKYNLQKDNVIIESPKSTILKI